MSEVQAAYAQKWQQDRAESEMMKNEKEMFDVRFKLMRREIKQLKGEKKRLEDRLFKSGAMNSQPCFVCGYNGEGFFDPVKHRCAARHHRLFKK